MLMLLFIPIFYVVACAHRYLQLYAPSNLLIARVRSSPPRWRTAMLLMTLAYALIWATHYLSTAIEAGAPGWLNLVVVVLAWDSIKLGLTSIFEFARSAIAATVKHRNGRWMGGGAPGSSAPSAVCRSR